MSRHYADHAPLICRSFTDNGLPTGEENMNENTLLAPKDYYLEALKGEEILVSRLIIHIKDVGNLDADAYGNNITLVNGIWPYIQRKNGDRISLVGDDPIFTNSDWAGICFDALPSTYGQGNQSLAMRWSLNKYGKGITLVEGDRLGFRIKDDLTGLTHHHVLVQGVHQKTPHPDWEIVIPF